MPHAAIGKGARGNSTTLPAGSSSRPLPSLPLLLDLLTSPGAALPPAWCRRPPPLRPPGQSRRCFVCVLCVICVGHILRGAARRRCPTHMTQRTQTKQRRDCPGGRNGGGRRHQAGGKVAPGEVSKSRQSGNDGKGRDDDPAGRAVELPRALFPMAAWGMGGMGVVSRGEGRQFVLGPACLASNLGQWAWRISLAS